MNRIVQTGSGERVSQAADLQQVLGVKADGPVLVCAGDRRYAMPLAVMLKSAALNYRGEADLCVYVLDGGIGRRNRARIERTLAGTRVVLHWVGRPSKRVLQGLPVFGHVRIAAYYRILTPELLPAGQIKAIYLDADTVVLGDVGDLWRVEMAGCPLLAVTEGEEVTPGYLGRMQELGMPSGSKYLNSGVLAMDLALWRAEGIHRRVLGYLRDHAARIRFWDQDGINAVLAGRWGELDRRWNTLVDCTLPVPAEERGAYVEMLRRRAKLVHFTTCTKPWHYSVDHPACELFFEYLDRTAWAGWRPRPTMRIRLCRYSLGRMLVGLLTVGLKWGKKSGRRASAGS